MLIVFGVLLPLYFSPNLNIYITCGIGPRIFVNNDCVIERRNGWPAAKIQNPMINCPMFIAGCSLHHSNAQQPMACDSLHFILSPSPPYDDRKGDLDSKYSVSLQMCVLSFPGMGMKKIVDISMDTTPPKMIKSRSSNLNGKIYIELCWLVW